MRVVLASNWLEDGRHRVAQGFEWEKRAPTDDATIGQRQCFDREGRET